MLKISEESTRILAADMCIDLDHLKAKVESPEIRPYSSKICEVIEVLCGFVGKKSGKEINDYCYSLIGEMESEPDFFLDSLRMAFYRYTSGGLLDLFLYQENEAWYPKVVLSKVLCPNDIDSLDEDFLIYRGCDVSEFESKEFGQSWSTSEDIAKKFAFEHYESQEWFDIANRVVVRAKYEKCNTLYSDQTESGEFEIAVKPNMLRNVEVVSY
jgi:hypothetical protein